MEDAPGLELGTATEVPAAELPELAFHSCELSGSVSALSVELLELLVEEIEGRVSPGAPLF